MRIPSRYAPIVFSALLSAIMVAVVSGFVLTMTQGFHAGLAQQWLRSCLTTWPVAFPTVAVVAPLVRRLGGRLTGGVARSSRCRTLTPRARRRRLLRAIGRRGGDIIAPSTFADR
jgi:hypothetical protein